MVLSQQEFVVSLWFLAFALCNADLSESDAPIGLEAEQLETITSSQKMEYQAEVKQLMNLIINSIYSNVEVFLRELISNGSDALDKIRIIGLTNREALGDDELCIRIRADPEKKELHIIDNGVGMSPEELKTNLGTIAKSGTKDFAKAAQEGDAQSLIGQFGVGFYSAFLVADKVTVISKAHDSKQNIWHSDAAQNFVIAEDPRGETVKHGTHIILHMKESQLDFLKEDTLKDLIARYSEFISFPIYLWTSRTESEEVPLTEEEIAEKKAELEKAADEEIKDEETEKKEEEKKEEEIPKTKTVEKTVYEWTHVNKKQPIWTRPASEITKEEYDDFYKHISKDYQGIFLLFFLFSVCCLFIFSSKVLSQRNISRPRET